MRASSLVEGPRGRRFLLEACYRAGTDRSQPRWTMPLPLLEEQLLKDLSQADLDRVGQLGLRDLITALGESVGYARYWQEPFEEDDALTAGELHPALAAVAEAISHSPAIAWFTGRYDAGDQVETLVDYRGPLVFSPAPPMPQSIDQWRTHVLDEERRAAAGWGDETSGPWWVHPWAPGIPFVETSRRLPDGAPARLLLEEDDGGAEHAIARNRPGAPGARVLELRTAYDWVRLVERYPLELTASRRNDWRRATGVTSRWFIPDYAAAAADHDAIHLSPLAYLEAAGRPMPVAGGHTLLAGWNPDITYWLTDIFPPPGQPEQWTRDPIDFWTWQRD